jgi:hypothetical protein
VAEARHISNQRTSLWLGFPLYAAAVVVQPATEVIRSDRLRRMDMVEQRLKAAIEGQHGGTAHLAYIDAVSVTRQGRPVEGGIVFVFDLEGHPAATRAYGWTTQVEDERQVHVVLQAPPIASAQEAVRCITLAERRDDWSIRAGELSRALLQQLGLPRQTKPAEAA